MNNTKSNSSDDASCVLKYWRDLEIFNIPSSPTTKDNSAQTKVTTLWRTDARSTLPWQLPEWAASKDYTAVHVVYLGVADMEDLARLTLQAILPDEKLSERETQHLKGQGWLAAFVVNDQGIPKPESYMPASFTHGIEAFCRTGMLDNINTRLRDAQEEFAQRCHRAESTPGDREAAPAFAGQPMDWDALDAERDIVCALLGEAAKSTKLRWRVVVRSSRIKKTRQSDTLEAAADYLNSFYLDDLDRLILQAEHQKPFGAALSQYLGAPLPLEGRVDILTRHASMAELVSAQHLPSARWPSPSKYPLVLAQQAAVSYVLRSLGQGAGVMGINGPPGTGKTTLLCDVIAEIVTERARRIAALDSPKSLFDEAISLAGNRFSPLKASVMDGTSIVVTSNNNNAVKNITQELPARAKISDEEFPSAAYFDEVIHEVFRQQKVFDDQKQPIDAWGLIAAALGNVSNRRSFSAGFFRDEYVPRQTAEQGAPLARGNDAEPCTEASRDNAALDAAGDGKPRSMKQLLETASDEGLRYEREWSKARSAFLDLQAQWERQRDVLVEAERAAQELDRSQARMGQLQVNYHSADEAVSSCEKVLMTWRERQAEQSVLVMANRSTLNQCEAAHFPTLWDRLMRWLGHETPRMAARRYALEAPTRALQEAVVLLETFRSETTRVEESLRNSRARRDTAQRELDALRQQLFVHQQAVDAGLAAGAKHLPSAAFWSLPVEQRHRASIAVYPALDQLRAKLFLAAVELHRLSILANASKFIGNLRLVNRMLTNNLQGKLPLDERHWLWDVFFFVVPVVSTTLASFDRLFAGMGQDSLGWLLIDEAGQATPQSAAGAIWRSRRAVIVGDPLQIEPVFTVPLRLTEQLRRQHGVDPLWSPADESVQTLADRITPFGSWIEQAADLGDDASRIWTGLPLRTHRRCDDPMFTVANRIAYADQMVHGNVDAAGVPQRTPFTSALGDSAWFQVVSMRVRHPVSEDELDVLRQALIELQREPARLDKDPGKPVRIYVISPFRKIRNACQKVIKDGKFEGVECGTVHTFQGKEAEVVFLLLGTAPGAQGAGAREWAKSKPNLLNVAITRAKCRLYVIGDVNQWGHLTYFSELRDALPVISPPFGEHMALPAIPVQAHFDA